MDFAKLADDLLGIVKAAAPLVGLSEEVEAAERLLSSATSAYETIKVALDPAKAAEVEAGFDAFAAAVNQHAERTKASLG